MSKNLTERPYRLSCISTIAHLLYRYVSTSERGGWHQEAPVVQDHWLGCGSSEKTEGESRYLLTSDSKNYSWSSFKSVIFFSWSCDKLILSKSHTFLPASHCSQSHPWGRHLKLWRVPRGRLEERPSCASEGLGDLRELLNTRWPALRSDGQIPFSISTQHWSSCRSCLWGQVKTKPLFIKVCVWGAGGWGDG